MNLLAELSGCPVHVDLPCGYTPRAIRFSRKGLRFVGLDLPAAIDEADPVIVSLIEPENRRLVKFAAVDATNYESLEKALYHFPSGHGSGQFSSGGEDIIQDDGYDYDDRPDDSQSRNLLAIEQSHPDRIHNRL